MSNEIISGCGCCGPACCLQEDSIFGVAQELNSPSSYIDSVVFYSGNVATRYVSCYFGTVQTFSREQLDLPNRRECAGGSNSYWYLRIQQRGYYNQGTSQNFSGEISQDGYLIGLPESYNIYCRYGADIYLLCFTRSVINYRLEFVDIDFKNQPNIHFYSFSNTSHSIAETAMLGYGINYNFTVKLFNNDTDEVITTNLNIAVVFTVKLITTFSPSEVVRNITFYGGKSSDNNYVFYRTGSQRSTGFSYNSVIDIVPLKVEFYLGLKLIKTMNLLETSSKFFEGFDQL